MQYSYNHLIAQEMYYSLYKYKATHIFSDIFVSHVNIWDACYLALLFPITTTVG